MVAAGIAPKPWHSTALTFGYCTYPVQVMPSKKPTLSDVIDATRTATETIKVGRAAANALASASDLRRRAEEHTAKAEHARTRLGRAWHLWRAGRLNERAADIERK